MHYYLPRSASWIEEMEKRSRRRTRDLVALAASQGLSENEIRCARISMMARSTNAPCKGRIQKRKTTLHLLKSGLQRTAGPYKSVESRCDAVALGSNISVCRPFRLAVPHWFDHGPVFTPRSSNRTGRFPASGSRTKLHAFTHGTSCPSLLRRTSPKCA